MQKRRRFTSWFADQHTIHRCTKCVMEVNRAADALKTKSVLLPGIVTILYDSLLNHMTILTKVGASYFAHMNDDASEVDSFSHGCYQALSSRVFEKRACERS